MFLNVKRGPGNTSKNEELIAAIGRRFRTQHWPVGHPVPEVYFDPRSLALDPADKAVSHAKCVVIDGSIAFVSSANFTEAAQIRNIEIGVLIRSRPVSERLVNFFFTMITGGVLKRAL